MNDKPDWIRYLEDEKAVDPDMNDMAAANLRELNELMDLHRRNTNAKMLEGEPVSLEEYRRTIDSMREQDKRELIKRVNILIVAVWFDIMVILGLIGVIAILIMR